MKERYWKKESTNNIPHSPSPYNRAHQPKEKCPRKKVVRAVLLRRSMTHPLCPFSLTLPHKNRSFVFIGPYHAHFVFFSFLYLRSHAVFQRPPPPFFLSC